MYTIFACEDIYGIQKEEKKRENEKLKETIQIFCYY